MSTDDIISKALDISFCGVTAEDIVVVPKTTGIENDFEYARENIKSLINNGSDAIDEIIKIAKAGDNPRAFEVVSLLLKTVADMNKLRLPRKKMILLIIPQTILFLLVLLVNYKI